MCSDIKKVPSVHNYYTSFKIAFCTVWYFQCISMVNQVLS